MEVQLKSAREMFEELEFELDDCSNFEGQAKCLNYQIIKPFGCIFKEITFYLETKEIGWDNVMVTTPLLKAINKQVEELGWNE